MSAERPDVLAAAEPFVQPCGPCDFGVTTVGCACPPGDYRPVMFRLMQEVERLRAERDALMPVADAAKAWRAQFEKPTDSKPPRMRALMAAVDALNVATEGEA